MRTTKRMIYYYFGGKEQLFVAVLERAYAEIRRAEQEVDVDQLDPLAALRRIAELTFDHHESHPDFIRLVSIENIHRARHMAKSAAIANLGTPAIDVLARILERGRAEGVITREIDAVDLHMMISAFCVFRVANRHTFGTLFEPRLGRPAAARPLPGDARRHGRRLCVLEAELARVLAAVGPPRLSTCLT